jgi:branched-subunit amino acid transport protein
MTAVHDVPYLIVTIGCVAAVSFLSRASFAFLPESVKLPPRMQRSLRHAPVCALAAIIAPAIFTSNGAVALQLSNYRIWAVLAAGIVFAKTRNMLAMMVVGMAVFTLFRLA